MVIASNTHNSGNLTIQVLEYALVSNGHHLYYHKARNLFGNNFNKTLELFGMLED